MAIEAALIFPVFFLFIMGLIIVCLTFTKRMMLHESLVAAANAGVRDGELFSGTCKGPAVAALNNELNRWPLLIGLSDLQVIAKEGSLVSGSIRTVEFSVTGKVSCPGMGFVFGENAKISASTIVPLEPGGSCGDLDS